MHLTRIPFELVYYFCIIKHGMFEDNEQPESLCKTCAFCKKEIKQMPAQDTTGNLNFCDIVCAKLYYDNTQRFTFNAKQYNTYFEQGELAKRAADVFGKARWFVFELMPVYIPQPCEIEYNQPDLMIKRYRSILNPTLLKSIGIADV